jgi:hypothetical protein
VGTRHGASALSANDAGDWAQAHAALSRPAHERSSYQVVLSVWCACGSGATAHQRDRFVFAWRFSNAPTEYIVKIHGSKPAYGRCAIAALGVSAMHGKPVEIETTSVSTMRQFGSR